MIDKYVCIKGSGILGLIEGEVYGISRPASCPEGFAYVQGRSGYTYKVSTDRFLKLPPEPKNCFDMTMEEYLAMVCLRDSNPSLVEFLNGESRFISASKAGMPSKDSSFVYRVKPTKTKQQLEIESIEKEMIKLTYRLNKLKGE